MPIDPSKLEELVAGLNESREAINEACGETLLSEFYTDAQRPFVLWSCIDLNVRILVDELKLPLSRADLIKATIDKLDEMIATLTDLKAKVAETRLT